MSEAVFRPLSRALALNEAPWGGGGAQAAVLVALTDEPQPRVLLARRAQHLRLHPGEVAFPGGKREAMDISPWETALREAFEEVQMPQDRVVPVAELPPLRTRTGFEVHPCIARVPVKLDLHPDLRELSSIFWPRLAVFADNARFRLEAMSDGECTRMVPHYRYGRDNIWGVTAAVLAQIANIALDAQLDLKRDWKEST